MASHIPRLKGDQTIHDVALKWGIQSLLGYVWLKRNKFDRTGVSIKFHDLASSPDKVLRQILKRANLSYVDGQERFWEREQHALSGNLEVVYTAAGLAGSRPQHIRVEDRWRDLEPSVISEVYSCFLVQVSRRVLEYPDLRPAGATSNSTIAADLLARILPAMPFAVSQFVCRVAVVLHMARKYGVVHTAKTVAMRMLRVGSRA